MTIKMMLIRMVYFSNELFGNCMSQASYTLYSALHDPWCLLCLVRRVSLAEYILILRVYSHLLQMISSMMVSARPAFIPLGMRTKPLGTVL